jgi:hypothetical protein
MNREGACCRLWKLLLTINRMSYLCCSFGLAQDALAHYGAQMRQPDPALALQQLAAAIAMDPCWQNIPGATLVVRPHPGPALAVFGEFNAATHQYVRLQGQLLNHACRHLRYVDYDQVTRDCETLATRLCDAVGLDALRSYEFWGIPRGGVIVLGILSYLLGLSAAQFEPMEAATPVVIVDDCALSGGRFQQVLPKFVGRSVIFAPLYSNPTLRSAILNQESRVSGCVSGGDLQDYGPAVMGASYDHWQAENLARLEGTRYWLGQPDYICFPWNEPDQLLWSPLTHQLDRAWRIVPADLCLKNRLAPDQSPIPVWVQAQPQGTLYPSAEVMVLDVAAAVIVGNLQTHQTFELEGVAAAIWRALMAEDNVERAIATLAEDYDAPMESIQMDVLAFIKQLRQQGLITSTEGLDCQNS